MRSRIRQVTRFFDIDEANATLDEVAPLLATLADQRADLIRLRDQTLAARPTDGGRASADTQAGRIDDAEVRRIQLRMKGIIDQMAAAVARIDALGITLRDIERGLIDFPALVNGRQVWLCWQLGDNGVTTWHELDDGFGGRRSIAELE